MHVGCKHQCLLYRAMTDEPNLLLTQHVTGYFKRPGSLMRAGQNERDA
jgi:GTP cyclohydrolase I